MAEKPTYGSVEELVAGEAGSVHIECAHDTAARALQAVRVRHAGRRCAFYLAGDGVFHRDTVGSYLRFF